MTDNPVHNHPDMAWDMAWQTIDTAPKDGTSFLGYGVMKAPPGWKSMRPLVKEIWWEAKEWHYSSSDDCTMKPTHWMPLPPPPNSKE